jgi:hypothetical protein
MWRNGRRNGLKIRSREKRGMGSNPIIGTVFIGKMAVFVQTGDFSFSPQKCQKAAFF